MVDYPERVVITDVGPRDGLQMEVRTVPTGPGFGRRNPPPAFSQSAQVVVGGNAHQQLGKIIIGQNLRFDADNFYSIHLQNHRVSTQINSQKFEYGMDWVFPVTYLIFAPKH